MSIEQIFFLSIPSLLLSFVGFVIIYMRIYPQRLFSRQILNFLSNHQAKATVKGNTVSSNTIVNDAALNNSTDLNEIPMNSGRDRVKKSVEKEPIQIEIADSEPDGEQTIYIDRNQNVHVLSKKDVEKKKEKSRELYYKKLYEEVTKFNISTDNLDYESLQLLADSYGKIGNKEEAVKVYDLAFFRAVQTIIKDKIITLFSMGAYEDVIQCFAEYEQRYLEEDYKQDDFSMIGIYGKCYYYLQDYDKGLEIFSTVLDKNNVSKDIIYSVGMTYEAKEDYEKALHYYEQIFDIDVDYRDVKQKLNLLTKKNLSKDV